MNSGSPGRQDREGCPRKMMRAPQEHRHGDEKSQRIWQRTGRVEAGLEGQLEAHTWTAMQRSGLHPGHRRGPARALREGGAELDQ